MTIVARRVSQEQDGIPGYMAHPVEPGPRPGILMAHHAHGVTGDYKIDAYRLAELGFNVLVPSFFNMFGIPGTNHIGAGADLQAKHSDGEFLEKMDEAWRYLTGRMIRIRPAPPPSGTAWAAACSSPSPPTTRSSARSSSTTRQSATSPRPRTGPATRSSSRGRSSAHPWCSAGAWTTSPRPPSRAPLWQSFIANGQLVEWHSFSDANHGFRHPDNEGYQPHYADLVWPLVTSFLHRLV